MAQTMIEVKDLTKQFGSVQALRGVSFSVPRGQVIGLLGPNGAGKTTAMRLITGYLAPTGGTVLVDGRDVVEDPLACCRRIGYLPEGNPLYTDLTIRETLRFAARMRGLVGSDRDEAVEESIIVAGLEHMERRLIGTLSRGFRQRVGLAQALLHKPDILILDEPTSGLDPNQQEEMRGLIRRLGEEHTVMLSTHILPEVEAVCDRAMIIHLGRLVADGTVAEIKRRATGGPAVGLVLRGGEDAVRTAFEPVDFVREVHVESVPGEDGVLRVRVGLEGSLDRSHMEALAAIVSERGLGLSELRPETATLEQIFAELTADEDEDLFLAGAVETADASEEV